MYQDLECLISAPVITSDDIERLVGSLECEG